MEANEILKEKISFESHRRLSVLKKRTKRCCCKYCGGRLKLRRIIFSDDEDTRVEIFCGECDRIEYGVEREIYQSAKFFVENSKFNCFPDLEGNEKTRQMTIAKVCEIMSWHDQNIGILDENGFNISLCFNENFIGECITLSDEDLDEEIKIEDKFVL